MTAIKLVTTLFCLCLITSCASNKNSSDNAPVMERSESDELVPGSVKARILILETNSGDDDVSIEAEIVEVVQNGPQSPLLNQGERVTLVMLKYDMQNSLPEAGDTITALLQSKEIVQMGSDPTMQWELAEIFY